MLASDAGGSRAALVLAAVLLVVISLAGARRAEAAGAASPPAPPAVHTTYLVAVTQIQGDSFQFEREGRTMTIRLRDADSSDLAPPAPPERRVPRRATARGGTVLDLSLRAAESRRAGRGPGPRVDEEGLALGNPDQVEPGEAAQRRGRGNVHSGGGPVRR
ncbi:MAG: hypothetical protein WBE00_01735, partial [Phycisphaerae bacterium]